MKRALAALLTCLVTLLDFVVDLPYQSRFFLTSAYRSTLGQVVARARWHWWK